MSEAIYRATSIPQTTQRGRSKPSKYVRHIFTRQRPEGKFYITSPSPLQHRCGPHSRSVSKLHSARLASLQKTLINVLTTAGGQNSAFCTCPRRGIRWCKRTGSRSNRRSVTLVRLLPRVGGDREKSRCASCTMRCKEFSDQSVMSDDLTWKVLF
jgi:hypothetical protein